jgi:hypothetical protein
MMETTLSVPNAILFVFDPSNEDVEVPEYQANQLTAANPSSVSIGTRAYVDGDVTVRLGNTPSASDRRRGGIVFEHSIETPGRKVAVFTAELQKLLEAKVSGHRTKLVIRVDDPTLPSLICIEAR